MKKIILALTVLTLFACDKKSNNPYVTLQGSISNSEIDSISILGRDFKRQIKVNDDGTYKDTLTVKDGFHGIYNGAEQSFVYLKNGYDMTIDFDNDQFPESIAFGGEGAITNQYLIDKLEFIKEQNLSDYGSYFELEKEAFDDKMATLKSDLDKLLQDAVGLEEEVYKMETEANNKVIIFFQDNYEREHQKLIGLRKGDPSPGFNYPDQNGKNVSLEDLRGKYVYVDVWATWCAPCKMEIPYLKQMDEDYQGKDIEFVSLSIDKIEHKEKWLKMIEEENLGGIQLLADKDFSSEFVMAYNITGIPRFILIDKEGKIISSNAPRPSNPGLREILDNLEL